MRRLVVLGRRDESGVKLAWICRSPPAYQDCAIVLEQASTGDVSGFAFTPPDRVEALDKASLGQPLFDSGFLLEDGLEDFWRWPVETLTGTPSLLGHACTGLAFQRPPGQAGTCSRVEVWIATDLAVPLLMTKVNAAGETLRRFAVRKLARDPDAGWVPVSIDITDGGGSSRTTWNNVRGELNPPLSPSLFTPAGLREHLAPVPAAGE